MACITFVDDQVEKILDALDETGLNKNTIVFLTSDHGWHMGEKNHLFKNSPWEESSRIPLFLEFQTAMLKGL